MAKWLPVEEVDDVSQVKPEEFRAIYQTDSEGRKVLVVSAKKEIVKRADGTQDVKITVPTLDLINKFKEENA